MKPVVLYKVLSNHLRDLARLRLPIASLYERFKHNTYPDRSVEDLPTVFKPNEDEPFKPNREHLRGTFDGDLTLPSGQTPLVRTKTQREVEEMFVYKEPKLKHLNEGYSREKELMLLKDELHSDQLVEAYDEILKFNNQASEYNYMVEVFHEFQKQFLGGVDSELTNSDSWVSLYKQFDSDHDNLLNKTELRTMLMACQAFEHRLTHADAEFVFRQIASCNDGGSGKHITPKVWLEWVRAMRRRRFTSLIHFSEKYEIYQMPTDTPEQLQARSIALARFNEK